jgi:Sulfotransferase family
LDPLQNSPSWTESVVAFFPRSHFFFMFNLRPISLGSMPDIKPVFVVGAGRSGTTPLQLALNMHPQLGVYGETQAFFVHRKFGAKPGARRLQSLIEYWRPMVASCCRYADLLDNEEIRAKLASVTSYAEVVNLIVGAIATREGKSRWGEKSPAHVFRLPEIRSCFPNAQIVHIIRDPRAVVSSAIKAFGGGQFSDWNVYRIARYWVRCFRIHCQHQSEQAHGLYTLVRYEDFVTRSETTLRGISSFLGMDFVRDMLEGHRVASSYVQKEGSGDMPAHHALTQKPLDTGRADAWKKALSPEHTKLIEQIAGKQMQTLGYEPASRKEYHPPRLRAVYFSTRWIAAEGRRIADKQARTPYWAVQRMVESGEEPHSAPQKVSPPIPVSLSSQPTIKRKVVGRSPNEAEEQIRRSGT